MADFAQELAVQIPRLRRYARALTHDAAWADDLVQDTLERALQRRWLFRLPGNLTAWLLTILYRLYINDATRPHMLRTVAVEDMPECAAPDDMAIQLDMQRALARLSPEHRAVILLVGLEQVSYKEAAHILGVPSGTVMSRLARAREHLRQLLSGEPVVQAGGRAIQPGAPAHLTRIK